jgi:hypothetical protein
MTDKDIIRAEIFRRYAHHGTFEGVIAETREDECSSILDFIDSMQENPCDGCTNRKGCITCENGELKETELSHSEVTKISDQDNPLSEDFKRFEEEYLEKEKDEILCVYDRHAGLVDGMEWMQKQIKDNSVRLLDEAYEHGKYDMRQQMMKDAMPRKVKFLDSISYNHCIAHLGMSEDDTVKLILVKED